MPLLRLLSKLDFRFFSLLLLVLMSGLRSSAQEHSQYDRGTPPQNAAGVSSIGSFSSSDIGAVNLANGGLNIKLPLGLVGGRGFSLPITLNYSSKVWSASRGEDDDNSLDSGPVTRKVVYASYGEADYSIDYYNRIVPGWTIGAQPLLRARIINIAPIPNSCLSTYTLTKLTLVLPDKGEIELRDELTNGAPIAVPTNSGCGYRDGFRGARWHATDGSGLLFVSDHTNGPVQGFLAGYVITADGTRYRFEDNLAPYQGIGLARCHSITDRNGNQITISYPNADEVRYTDQLGRITTVQRGVADPSNPSVTLDLLITFPGYNNQPRYYKVKFGPMSEHYRADVNPALPVGTGKADCEIAPHGYYLIPMGTMLFPNSWGKYAQFIDFENVVSQITLPDGRALNFKYNEYGEVAEVQLPTGGKVQYDYAPSLLPSGNTLNWEKAASGANVVSDVNNIDRALTTRRTYAAGSTPEATWSYGYSSTGSDVRVYAGTINGQLLSFEKHYFLAGSRYLFQQQQGDPDGSGYSRWSTGLERRTEVLNASGTVISASEQDWSQRVPLEWTTGFPQEQPENDNRVNEARRYLDTGSFAKTITLYDNVNYPRANNVAEVKEYDYDQTLKRRTVTSYLTVNNGSNYQTDDAIHLLGLPVSQTVYDGNGSQVARTVTEYDVYTEDGDHDKLTGYVSVSQHNSNYGETKKTRGNATRIGVWLNTTNSYIYTYPRYDIVGNVVGTKDARGNVSTISFADDFGDGSSPGSLTQNPATPTYALPTLITSPPPVAGAAVHTARSQYDYWSGQLTGFKDRNNVITQTIYDPFNRPTLIKAALNTSVEARTRMYYAPATQFGITLANNDVLTASDQTNVDDQVLRSWTVTDGFGRTVESWKRDPQGDLKVITVYDALGRVKQTSNPFRSGETAQYTTTVYDLAGRVTSVTTPDNAAVTTEYNGNLSLVTDQQSKKRMSRTNALGQLTQVWEITPNDATTYPGIQPVSFANQSLHAYQTNYDYDVLDNLVRVTQGSQQRFFLYDSLKRLIRARNPEQSTYGPISDLTDTFGNSAWSVKYEYDANGNLTSKTDARGTVSTYAYDALNRNTTINYSDTTVAPDIKHVYDGATKGVGRLWSSYAGGDETIGDKVEKKVVDSYDEIGRSLTQRQLFKTGGVWQPQIYQTSRTYDRDGAVTSQTYPSEHTVIYSYDVAGRSSSFSGNLGGSNRTYSTGILYSPFGGIEKEQFGTDTALYHKSFYNIRGQLFDTRVSSVNDTWDWNRGRLILYYSSNHLWSQSGTDNNGNVLFAETWIPPENATLDQAETLSEQSYEYDALNRLKSVTEARISVSSGWVWQPQLKQSYDYDRYGNRTIKTGSAYTWGTGVNSKQFTVDAATNRLGVPGGQSGTMSYDNAGNLTTDTYSGAGTRVYDAENRMTKAWGGNNQWQEYTYDANGHRTRRKIDGVETWQVYGFDGELLAEYPANGPVTSPQKEYGYRNGELLVTAETAAGTPANVAVDKPTTQSSDLAGGVGSRAVDGNTSGNWYDNSVTHTNYDNQAWWQVDLGGTYSVSSVELWNRTDCCSDRLTNFNVILLDAGQSVVSSVNHPGPVGNSTTITISGNARYVKVQLVGTNYLSLAEVKVWGTPSGSAASAVNDFSSTQNPNGSWRYGYKSSAGAAFTPYSSNANLFGAGLDSWLQGSCCPMITRNATGATHTYPTAPSVVQPADVLNLHPGPAGEVSVVRWTAAATGVYTLAGRFQGIDTGGTTTDISIRHNSTVIWSGNINGYGNQATFSLSATLAAGDTLDFQVGYGSNQTYNSDSTGLAATITQSGASSPTNVKWLLTDHLGTPRMIVAQTGALANIKRHDYLPFGEELFAPAGGRTSGWGYSSGNGIRQQFTQKERDSETGLDYFLARYYSSTQGRFTSPDEFTGGPDELYYFVEDASANPTFYADLRKPQSLNKYQYAYNNPLRWIDPDGHDPEEPEPQDPKPVVPVPVPIAPGMPPVPVTISPGTPGPSDQQIIEGAKSVLDTVADYTGITWIADKIRPFCPFCPKPTPAPAQPTTAAQPSPTTGTPPQTIAQPQARPEPVQSRGRGRGRSRGRGNQKDTGLRDKSDADVAKGARDRSLPKAERQRYKKEEKARGERNRKKREDK